MMMMMMTTTMSMKRAKVKLRLFRRDKSVNFPTPQLHNGNSDSKFTRTVLAHVIRLVLIFWTCLEIVSL